MITLINENGSPCILHFQGCGRRQYYGYLEDYVDNHITLPRDLSIVTICTGAYMCSHSPLIRQLEKCSVPYINSAKDFTGAWVNPMKLRFILEALDGITTPYVLVLDASDVVIDHLDDIIEKFQSYDKKVLFGASLTRYPCIAIDIVKDRKRLGPYHYLNAGTCIGKTEDVRDFYQLCVSLDLEDNEYFSEQFIVRTAFNISQDKVFFDYKRLCFQTMGKAEIKATGRPDVEEVI